MRRACLLVLLFALAPLGETMANTLEQDFPTVGTFHWGPFRVRPFFLLRATGYDSNVFLEDGTATSDFTSSPELGIRLFTLFRDRGVVQVEEILDYVWYAHNDELSHFNNAFQARAAYYMKRGVVFADLRTLSLRERPSTEIDYRIRRRERYFGAGWRFVWPKSSLQFRLGRDNFDYESGVEAGQNIPVALNRLEKAITITGSKRILPKTDFLMEWEGRRIDFDNEPVDPTQDSDSSSRRLSVGFIFDPSAFIKGSVKVGVIRLEPDNRAAEGYDGPVGDAILVYRLTGLTSFQIRGQRQVLFSTALNNVYFLDQGYGATLTQAVAERVAAEVGSDREKVSLPNETMACELDDQGVIRCETGIRTDWIRSYFGGILFRLSNLSQVGFRVGAWERDSTFEFLNRHRMTAQVIYSYNF